MATHHSSSSPKLIDAATPDKPLLVMRELSLQREESVNQELSKAIETLREREKVHLHVGEKMLQAAGGEVFLIDYLACAVLNRSSALLSGFCHWIENRNYICAAPLIRLQIDNCCRFFAVSLVDNPHDFTMAILEGKRVDKMKDSKNQRMTDRYLVETLAGHFNEIDKLYTDTSGYIHLSDKHFYDTFASSEEGERNMQMKIGPEDEYVPDEIRLQAVYAFNYATDIVFSLIQVWEKRKRHVHETGPSK